MIAYASSYPVIYYINNISPDPLLMMCVMFTILFIFKYEEKLDTQNYHFAYFFLIIASFFAVSAFFTKIMFKAPIVLSIFIYFAATNWKSKQNIFYKKYQGTLIFSFGAIIFMLLWSRKINWSKFMNFWQKFACVPKFKSSDDRIFAKINVLLTFFEKIKINLLSFENWIPSYFSSNAL